MKGSTSICRAATPLRAAAFQAATSASSSEAPTGGEAGAEDVNWEAEMPARASLAASSEAPAGRSDTADTPTVLSSRSCRAGQ